MTNLPEGNLHPDDPRSPLHEEVSKPCHGCQKLNETSELEDSFCQACRKAASHVEALPFYVDDALRGEAFSQILMCCQTTADARPIAQYINHLENLLIEEYNNEGETIL